MSRVYRVRVSETVTRVVHVKDGVERSFDMLGILSPREMEDLLRQQLAEGGFEPQEDGSMAKEIKGVIITVSPLDRTVKASISQDQEITATTELKDRTMAETRKETRQRLSGQARQEAEREISRQEDELQQSITRQLEGSLQEIRQTLDQAINRTLGEALRRRAAQLGEIEEISEDSETGALRIRVKV